MPNLLGIRIRRDFFWYQTTCWRLSIRLKCLLILLAVVFVAVTYKSALRGAYRFLTPRMELKPVDALVVEGWVLDSGRELARRLYLNGFAKFIIVTGGPLQGSSSCNGAKTWAEDAQRHLIAAGVKDNSLIMAETTARGTRQAAMAVARVLRERGIRSIIVITQRGHERRSLWTFRRSLRDLKVSVLVAAADENWFRADNWWRSDDGLVHMFVEYLSLGYYLLKGFV